MSGNEEAKSEKRRAANRANAARSTGPVTDEGRKASSRNALKHGLRAVRAVYEPRTAALAALLAREAGGAGLEFERPLRLAEALLDVRRVREARHRSILENMETGLMPYVAFDRYEKMALSRCRRAIRTFEQQA